MNAFEELGLKEELVRAIADLGFETPTPIQQKAIPILISGTTDFVGLAQTGTGKTAAFGLPLLQLLDVTISCTPAQHIGKSSVYALFKLHGLPVVIDSKFIVDTFQIDTSIVDDLMNSANSGCGLSGLDLNSG